MPKIVVIAFQVSLQRIPIVIGLHTVCSPEGPAQSAMSCRVAIGDGSIARLQLFPVSVCTMCQTIPLDEHPYSGLSVYPWELLVPPLCRLESKGSIGKLVRWHIGVGT